MKKLPALFLLTFATLAFAGPKGEKKDDLATLEKTLLDLTNAERKKESLKPLRWNVVLAKVARAHSDNMRKQKKELHELDGKKSSDRVKAAGYKYYRTGENVGSMPLGFKLADIMKAWMGSPGHRKNIVQDDFQEAGMGIVRDGEGRLYITQLFGCPPKK